MFTVGEFSQVAQVSKRLLRYYDEIGLLKPVHTDRMTGYRYYSAEQLPQLNRILVLKDLGLSLEQIRDITENNVSSDEIQGMLMLKKSEIEQQMQSEIQRIRNIEARLLAIRKAEAHQVPDVIVKQVPAQSVLSMRTQIDNFQASMMIYGQMLKALPPKSGYGLFMVIWHNGGLYEPNNDVEICRTIDAKSHPDVVLSDELKMSYKELPAVPAMATYVVRSDIERMHSGYGAIGTWAEINHYRLIGSPREVFLTISQKPDGSGGVAEVQFPVERVPSS